jgi:filamin
MVWPSFIVFCLSEDPYGRAVTSQVNHQGQTVYVEYSPKEVGPHTVEIFYGGKHLPGSPYTANAFDASRVQLADISNLPAIGQEVSFKGGRGFTEVYFSRSTMFFPAVDTASAGVGDLDVQVTCDGRAVAVKKEKVDHFVYVFTFTPMSPRDHLISVMFNNQPMPGSFSCHHASFHNPHTPLYPGSPKQVRIQDPRSSLSTSNAMPSVAVGKMANSLIRTRGLRISLRDVQIQIIGHC